MKKRSPNDISKRLYGFLSVLLLSLVALLYSGYLGNFFMLNDDFWELSFCRQAFETPATLLSGFSWLTSHFAFMFNIAVFKAEPFWYNLTNLSIHLVNIALLGWAVFLLSGKRVVALIAMVLFGFSSQGVEAVLWISARCHLLAFTFSFASLICFVKRQRGGGVAVYSLSVFFALLAALSQFNGLVLPLFLAAFIYADKGVKAFTKKGLETLRLLSPYLLISGIYLIVYIFIAPTQPVGQYVSLKELNLLRIGKYFLEYADIFYVNQKLFLLDSPWIFHTAGVFGVALLVFLFVRIKEKALRFWLLFTCAALLAVFTVPTHNYLQFSRYKYLPTAGFYALLAAGLYRIYMGKALKVFAVLLLAVFTVSGVWFNLIEQKDYKLQGDFHRILAGEFLKVYPQVAGDNALIFKNPITYSAPPEINAAQRLIHPYFIKPEAVLGLVLPEDLFNYASICYSDRGVWRRAREGSASPQGTNMLIEVTESGFNAVRPKSLPKEGCILILR